VKLRWFSLAAALCVSSAASTASAQARLALRAERTFARPARWTDDAARWASVRFNDDGSVVTVRTPANDGSVRVLEYATATGLASPERAERVENTSPDQRIRLRFTSTANDAQCRLDRVERSSGAARSLGVLLEPCATARARPAPSFSDDGSHVLVHGPLMGAPQETLLNVIDAQSAAVTWRSAYEMHVGGGADPLALITPRGDGVLWSHNRNGVELVRAPTDAVVYRGPSEGVLSPTLQWRVELPYCPFAGDQCERRAVLRAVGRRTRIQLAQGSPDDPASASFSADGSTLALFVARKLSVWSVTAAGARKRAELTVPAAFAMSFSADRARLAVVTPQGVVVYALR
jgi:hypothetical protein